MTLVAFGPQPNFYPFVTFSAIGLTFSTICKCIINVLENTFL